MSSKSDFCKRFNWCPTAVSLALGKIEWFDLTGLMELPNGNVAKIELASSGTVGEYDGFQVTIINPHKSKVEQKFFKFDDYCTERSDSRKDYNGGFKVISRLGWEWYIAVPEQTRSFCAAIESYIHYFSR